MISFKTFIKEDTEFLTRLYGINDNHSEIPNAMNEFNKHEKWHEVATRFVGIPKFKNKNEASKAVEQKLKDRAYQAGKDKMNKGVTPW